MMTTMMMMLNKKKGTGLIWLPVAGASVPVSWLLLWGVMMQRVPLVASWKLERERKELGSQYAL